MLDLDLARYLTDDGVFQIWHHRYKSGTRVEKHCHEDFDEIFWIVSGKARHSKNGKQTYIAAGDLYYFRPGDWHELEASKSCLEFINIDYPCRYTEDFCAYDPEGAKKLFQPTDDTLCRLGPYEIASLGHLISTWIGNRRDSNSLRHLLVAIAHAACLSCRPLAGNPPPDWLEHACTACNDPEIMRSGLQQVYRIAGRSPDHVARVFKQFTGMAPRVWLNNCRLEYAAKLLVESSLPVLEISIESGFNTLSHFYELFKMRFGIPALAFRKRGALTLNNIPVGMNHPNVRNFHGLR